MEKNINVWGFHNPIEHEEILIKENTISMSWKELEDLSKIEPKTREGFSKYYERIYPGNTKMSIAQCVGQLYKFIYEVKVDDYIIFPTKYNRMINIGQIKSEYYYDKNEEIYVNKRKVKWLKTLPRTMFSQGALYEVGSFLTLFKIKNYTSEFLDALTGNVNKDIIENDESIAATTDAIIENTKDYILKSLSKNYKRYELENVVDDLLKAMGYKTKTSPRGGDRGKDIIAYKDELPPRIIVQVKSQDGDIAETTVQSLKGAMREGDYGLFVTLSDYTKNAKKYLDSMPIIKSINGSELVDLILKYYDLMSEEFKDTIKLKKVFIPVVEENKM